MITEDQQPHAYQPVMAGLFAGIIATILNMVFDVAYRQSTGFELSAIINVSSIIFGTLLVLVLAGVVFALLDRVMKRPAILYIIVFLALSLLCLRYSLHVYRSSNAIENNEFHHLFSGIVIISGLLATFLIPYMATKKSAII